MNVLARWRIGARLWATFGILLLMLVAVASLGVSALTVTKSRVVAVVNESNAKISLANELRGQLSKVSLAVRNAILYEDEGQRARSLKRVAAAEKRYDETLERLVPLAGSVDEVRVLKEMSEASVATRNLKAQVIELIRDGKAGPAAELLNGPMQGPQEQWLDAVQSMINLQEEQNEGDLAGINKRYQQTVMLLVGLSVSALALGIFFAWSVTRSITQPINAAVQVARTVAAGDLTCRIEVKSNDEAGELLQALHTMNEGLSGLVARVRDSSDSIASSSTQIASGNGDLSQRTEQQANHLLETSSSMQRLETTVRANGESAHAASELATVARDAATRGGEVVEQVVATMQQITGSSQKIAEIVGVIDGIAFQTNILALNAAVEAARAGEQGRGFAVVASEVRALAQRSASAAREIKTLIGSSVERIETGATLANDAGEAMRGIVTQVQRFTTLIDTINQASVEQADGIGRVGQAMSQLETSTQHTAMLVDQNANAAQSLSQEAATLTEVVASFKLSADTPAGTGAAVTA